MIVDTSSLLEDNVAHWRVDTSSLLEENVVHGSGH